MADPTTEQMMRAFLKQLQETTELQKQTAERQLRAEQRLAAQATVPEREHVDTAVKRAAKKKKKVVQESHADRILKLVRKGPLSTAQIAEALGYDPEKGRGTMWGGIARLEKDGDVLVIQRPSTNGARGPRGPSIVFHSSHIKLLKPLP